MNRDPEHQIHNGSTIGSLFDAVEQAEDICRERHKDNAQSVAANPSPEAKSAMRQILMEMILLAGEEGITSQEIEDRLEIAKHKFSGRLTALAQEGSIVERGVRNGCTVWKARYAE